MHMTFTPVKCPFCNETNVVSNGHSKRGAKRYRCRNNDCHRNYFLLDYAYEGAKPGIDKKIIEMTANASGIRDISRVGIRDISRVLGISTDKVMDTLKKQQTP